MIGRKSTGDGHPVIELFRTDQYYIFLNGEHSLWWNRSTAQFVPKTGWDLAEAVDPVCLGICHGIVGKIHVDSVVEPRLMLIKDIAVVGEFKPGHVIYKIKSVTFLQLVDTDNLNLKLCKKHQHSATNRKGSLFDQKSTFAKTLGAVKLATNSIKTSTQQAAALAIPQVKSKLASKDKEKFEKRVIEELNKIFTDTDSFYFALTFDLTNTLQRQSSVNADEDAAKTNDDRFFWNKYMLNGIISDNNPLFRPWIIPVVQGYVQVEQCYIHVSNDGSVGSDTHQPRHEQVQVTLISRRSRHRAGTRYKRRGVDEDGHCANYVETEQVVSYQHHMVSFVQTRGSVPVFWSQPGYKYRPPPRLDKGPAETQLVFEKHFQTELSIYGPVTVVNLVEQSGKEKVIWDAYTNHLLELNEQELTYATFDFHEYCRGMHFENVSFLVSSLADVIREMGYCWTDKHGPICNQNGVFRVNCIDCLDRTNVVETALAKAVLEIQLTKLGLLLPEGQMPQSMKGTFQSLWANNGDVISKQYAGTNALKGDYTRTGERKLTGLMKDGMNSANRYLRTHLLDSYRQAALDLAQGQQIERVDMLCEVTLDVVAATDCVTAVAATVVPSGPPQVIKHVALAPEWELVNAIYQVSRYYLSRFKDAYRQATIDLMLGNEISEDMFQPDQKTEEEDIADSAEHVKLLIEDCKKLLINEPADILGTWGLIDADPVTGDPTETEMDTILILTKSSYYVAEYDEQIDRVTKYQQVELKDVSLIELGMNPSGSHGQVTSMLKLTKSSPQQHAMRVHYTIRAEEGYFHMFRSTNLRFFNTVAVTIKTGEEMLESLKAICEAFTIALELAQLPAVMYIQGRPLDRKKSKALMSGVSCRLGSYLDLGLTQGLTRNVSESQLVTLKSVGTKALSNISSQFSKINRLGQSLRKPNQRNSSDQVATPPIFTIEPSESKQTTPTSRRSSETSEDSEDKDPAALVRCARPGLSKQHMHLTDVGIVMKHEPFTLGRSSLYPLIDNLSVKQVVQSDVVSIKPKNPLLHSRSDLCFSPDTLTASHKIRQSRLTPPTSLEVTRQLSHSANEIEEAPPKKPTTHLTLALDHRCSSERDLTLNMVSSQSENALKSLRTNIASVIHSPAAVTKDMLSPFSKLAKGVTNLGSNLDPRRLKGGHMEPGYRMTEAHLEEIRRLEERWTGCRTKLIPL